ncbi:hypothetical protein ACFXKD_07615 [Nocardiopsis aegyptia]|uniref:hypothetical protein n=1 Tax=Nocardiopsis aegyptia TaxID=220378 RepID=UPI00366EB4D2
MTGLLIAAAIVLVVAAPVLLIALTGGPRTLFAEHDLPEPSRTRRAPRRADR